MENAWLDPHPIRQFGTVEGLLYSSRQYQLQEVTAMRVATGTVISGQVVLDDEPLVDGTAVIVISKEREDAVRLSPDELAELEAGIAEADRGDTISGDELFSRIGRYR